MCGCRTGATGDRGPAGLPGEAATKLFGNFDGDDGSLVRGSGIASAQKSEISDGFYVVPFDRDISDCALLAAPSSNDTLNPSSVTVGTFRSSDSAGVLIRNDFNDTRENADFSIAAFCWLHRSRYRSPTIPFGARVPVSCIGPLVTGRSKSSSPAPRTSALSETAAGRRFSNRSEPGRAVAYVVRNRDRAVRRSAGAHRRRPGAGGGDRAARRRPRPCRVRARADGLRPGRCG